MKTELDALVDALRSGRGFAHKRDIAAVMAGLPAGPVAPGALPNGDDCAALPLPGGGWQLLAIEGLLPEFVRQQPWFAGYSAVMVNLSDVAAMGGRPTAVVDALWTDGHGAAREILAGMQAACAQYGVPLVGGHTNLRSTASQLAVAVLGHATRLISSFAARPGDRLLMAVDLRGAWEGDAPFWNASTRAPAARLRADLDLLPQIAEAGLCDAGKDISMGGVPGTLLMLLEASRCGATLALDRLPAPPGTADSPAACLRWLSAFPSYGYLLAVRPEHAAAVASRFAAREIACADVGELQAGTQLHLRLGDTEALLWDFARQGFIQPDPVPEAVHA